jgi:hypothetical protein
MQVLSHVPFYMAGQIPRVKFSHLNSALEIMKLEVCNLLLAHYPAFAFIALWLQLT